MSYDPKCYDLALNFLEELKLDNGELMVKAHALAQEIQDTIEDFFAENELNK